MENTDMTAIKSAEDIAAEADEDMFLVDGTSSQKSYLIVARQGDILLGVKMYGLQPGEMLNVAGKTYLFCRVRSCRDPAVAAQIDNVASLTGHNVVKLPDPNMTLSNAWPNFEFEKADDSRASLAVGVFVRGSLKDTPELVLERLKTVDMFQALATYILEQAGTQHAINSPRAVAKWLSAKAQPHLTHVAKGIVITKAVKSAAEVFGEQVEEGTVGMHVGQLQAMMKANVEAAAAQFAEDNPEDLGDQAPTQAALPVPEDDGDLKSGVDNV